MYRRNVNPSARRVASAKSVMSHTPERAPEGRDEDDAEGRENQGYDNARDEYAAAPPRRLAPRVSKPRRHLRIMPYLGANPRAQIWRVDRVPAGKIAGCLRSPVE